MNFFSPDDNAMTVRSKGLVVIGPELFGASEVVIGVVYDSSP
jgi:hypothetical protein